MMEKASRGEIRVEAREMAPGEYTREFQAHRRFEGGPDGIWKKFSVSFNVDQSSSVQIVALVE